MYRIRWIAALLLCSTVALADHGKGQVKVDEIMQQKLTAAQKVLEGVAVNNFDQITRNADEMLRLSHLAEWKTIKTPRYDLYSNEFRRSCETLRTRAKEKNGDGAALAYVEMTLTCVRCHKYVREVRMAGRDDKPEPVALAK